MEFYHHQAATPARRPWSKEEDKVFEAALVAFPEQAPDRWGRVAGELPGRSPRDAWDHYQDLVADVELIEQGAIDIPGCWDDDQDDRAAGPPATDRRGGKARGEERRRGIPWSEEEHKFEILPGLGLHNIKLLNDALRMRWRWYEKARELRAWSGLQFKLSPDAENLFKAAMSCTIGRGEKTSFWYDRWLEGQSPVDLAPDLIKFATARGAKRRSVAEALHEGRWVRDIRGNISLPAIAQFMQLWCLIRERITLTDEDDSFSWRLTANGQYSAKSAYLAFFFGKTEASYARTLWKSRAPLKEKFFSWLVMRNRCWTADRLTKRGLQGPPVCTLCDQEPETIDHLLVNCSFSKTLWFRACQTKQLPDFTPTGNTSVIDWWNNTLKRCRGKQKRDLATFMIAGMRRIWLERNARVFERIESNVNSVVTRLCEELALWEKARARADQREE